MSRTGFGFKIWAAVTLAMALLVVGGNMSSFAEADKPAAEEPKKEASKVEKPENQPSKPEGKSAELKPSSDKPADAKPATEVKPLETIENSVGMKLVKIPAGKFLMGSPEKENGHRKGEFQREVTIDKPFYIGMYEVTQQQYEKIMGENPSVERDPDFPVANVPRWKATDFCESLSTAEGQTYRLPTEAEWEYACRAGTTTVFHCGDKLTYEDANFDWQNPYGSEERRAEVPHMMAVGSFKPNAFGLYDMHGNAWEWCLDIFRQRPDLNVLRGGGGETAAGNCRSAFRWWHSIGWQWTGFRVVRTVEPVQGKIPIPETHGVDQSNQFSLSDLGAKFDAAMATPAAELLPPVIVFPVVDGNRRIRNEGPALAEIAGFAIAHGPQKRMDICLASVFRRLRIAGCLKPGATLDDESLKICLASLGGPKYVLPTLVEKDGKLELSVAVQSSMDDKAAETKTHVVEAEKLTSVSKLIAQTVLEKLGVTIDDAALTKASTGQVRKAADLSLLSQMIASLQFGQENKDLLGFILRNPRCLPAWLMFVYDSNPAGKALERYANASRMVSCETIEIAACARPPASQDAFLNLLKESPKLRHDTYYYWTLALQAEELAEDELVNHIVETWRKNDPSYAGCVCRAEFLLEWAYQAHRHWGRVNQDDIERLANERNTAAKTELERALEINPLGWEAHGQMILLSSRLHLPFDVADEHFDAAVKLRPRYSDAYRYMLDAIQWNSDSEESGSLLSFARLCVASNYWDEGIPEIGRRAIENSNFEGAGAYNRSAFADPELWDTVLVYVDNAQRNAPPIYKKMSLNLFAKYGAYGEHYEEVADAFRKLEKEGTDPNIFWDAFTYDFLRDQVFSRTETGQTQVQSGVRAALDMGDPEKAQEFLDQLEAKGDDGAKTKKRYQLAIDACRDLQSAQTLDLTAEQMHAMFTGIDDRWKVEGDELVCRLPAGSETLILLPFGMQQVEVTGTISWLDRPALAQLHCHTRAQRDNVVLAYSPEEKEVSFQRGRGTLDQKKFEGEKAEFRLQLNNEQDDLEPIPETHWEASVVEEAPSGIGFQISAPKGHQAVVKIGALHIKRVQDNN